jgi:hypothetical protein
VNFVPRWNLASETAEPASAEMSHCIPASTALATYRKVQKLSSPD